MKYDVIALGELLIDFTDKGMSASGNPIFEANPGGAPCNVLAMLNKLGKKTAFIGRVGNDSFGKMLRNKVTVTGTDCSGLSEDTSVHTTLAFVHNGENGERSFTFYRDPGADMMLSEDDVDIELISKAKVFHFGTLSSTHESCRKATRKALRAAEEKGLIISFDPNLREALWEDLNDAKREIEYGLEHCNILKIADNELEFVTGEKEWEKGVEILRNKYDIDLICVTFGAGGSRAFTKHGQAFAPALLQSTTIDTTGAGDAFCGCILSQILDIGFENIKDGTADLGSMLRFANAGASVVTTRKGALLSMPEASEIDKLLLK